MKRASTNCSINTRNCSTRGRAPVLDDLCRDCPELLAELGRRVVRLHKLGHVLDVPITPAAEPEPLSLSDDRTWVSGTTPREVTRGRNPGPARLRDRRAARRRRHGDRLQGPAARARPACRPQNDPRRHAGPRHRSGAFREESRAIAALRHPNIVQIYEVGEFRRQPFFSLEFCHRRYPGPRTQRPTAAADNSRRKWPKCWPAPFSRPTTRTLSIAT